VISKTEPKPAPIANWKPEPENAPNLESHRRPVSNAQARGNPKPIHRFALQVAIALLLLGWLSAQSSVYPRLFHAQANALFSSIGTQRWLEFGWVDPASRRDRSDTRMLGMSNDASSQPEHHWRAVFSVRRRGFWPLATWLAVMLATPMSLSTRLRGLAIGAIALDVLLLLQIALIALCAFGATEPRADALWGRSAAIATALFNSPVPTYSLVFALWVWLANPAQGIALSGASARVRRWVGVNRGGSR
jgi:hypothetical protein